jgi:excisionase family DNA binding protein
MVSAFARFGAIPTAPKVFATVRFQSKQAFYRIEGGFTSCAHIAPRGPSCSVRLIASREPSHGGFCHVALTMVCRAGPNARTSFFGDDSASHRGMNCAARLIVVKALRFASTRLRQASALTSTRRAAFGLLRDVPANLPGMAPFHSSRGSMSGTNPRPDNQLPTLLTVDEAAAFLRKTRRALYSMVERGQIPGVIRLHRRLLFRADELLHWIDQKHAPSLQENER